MFKTFYRDVVKSRKPRAKDILNRIRYYRFADPFTGHMSIHEAARDGNLAEVKRQLDATVGPNVRNTRNGKTPIFFAAQEGRLNTVKLLLDRGAFANARDKDGFTPLHDAADGGNLAVVKLLVRAGASVNAVSDGHSTVQGKETPLHQAAIRGNIDVVKFLLEKGADPNARDSANQTPLHYGALSDRADIIEALLSGGATINAKTMMGVTAFQYTRPGKYTLGKPMARNALKREYNRRAVAIAGSLRRTILPANMQREIMKLSLPGR